jgi:hypothetical protein
MNVNPIEALLGTPGAFPPMLDIPPDADDETMVELAIALSLQVGKLTVIIGYKIVIAAVFIISYKDILEKLNIVNNSSCE